MPHSCNWCACEHSTSQLNCSSTIGLRFSYHQCQQCKSLYLSPFPEPEVLAKAYQQDYYGKHEEKKFSLPVEIFRKLLSGNRARRLANLLTPEARILDVGCGNGNFLMQMKQYGQFHLFGTELAGPSAERAKKQKGITVFTPEPEQETKEKGFDMISLFHVFEHLEKPAKKLVEYSEMLRENGYLVVSMPEPQSRQASLFGKHWFHLDPPRHLCLISRKEFIKGAKNAGLTHIWTSLFSMEQNPYGFIQSVLNTMDCKRDRLYEMLKGNLSITSFRQGGILLLHAFIAAILLPFSLLLEGLDVLSGKSATYLLIFQKKEPTSFS